MNSRTQPAEFDVIVVGNGVLGSSLAVELAGRGASVALVGRPERPHAASTATGALLGCFGEVTAASLGTDHGAGAFALRLKARDAWPAWLHQLAGGTSDGRDILTGNGTTVLLNSVGTGGIDSANFEAIRSALEQHGEPHETVDPEDVGWLDPDPHARPLRALHIPGERALDAGRLLRRLDRAARARGVRVVAAGAASVIDDGGRAGGVVLDNGATLTAARVVLAAGVGTQQLIDSVPGLGDCIPRLVAAAGLSAELTTEDCTQPETVIRTPNRAFDGALHVVPLGMARAYLGTTGAIVPDPLADPIVADLLSLLDDAHRQIRRNLHASSVLRVHVGNRPFALDGFPLLGETPLGGLWTMTGLHRDGLILSPLLAQEFARRLTGEQPALDLDACTPERGPLAQATRQQTVETTAAHALAAGYGRHARVPTEWQESLGDDLTTAHAAWADRIDADFTPPPELLAAARRHPRIAEWLRAYYAHCRARFGPATTAAPAVLPLRDHLAWAHRTLTEAQVWTPELDALVLAGHAAGTRPEELDYEAELPAGTAAAFRSLVRRRADREPLEYITGRATLFGLEFEVGEGTFIPRVHSEAMVGQALDRCPDGPLRVVDLCTGSGALALAVGALRPGSDIAGVDISASAVRWAKRNAERLRARVPGAVDFIEGDVADPRLLKDLDGRVDLLMANPPYVPDRLRIPPEYGVHQPPEASFSGADGLDAMRGIAVTAARLLRGGGVLAVEHLDALVDEVVDIIGAAGFEDITSHPDFTGFPRYVTARRPAG